MEDYHCFTGLDEPEAAVGIEVFLSSQFEFQAPILLARYYRTLKCVSTYFGVRFSEL